MNMYGSFKYSGFNGGGWSFSNPTSIQGYDIGIHNINKIFKSKRSVTIAIIDTYFDVNHYALTNLWTNPDDIPNNNIDDDKNGYIDDTTGWNFCGNTNRYTQSNFSIHGTFIAGIMCGKDLSLNFTNPLINTNYYVMCLQALSDESNGCINDLTHAILYAENNGAKICCLSLSTSTYNQELYDIMSTSSMLFIVAAGNESLNLDQNGIYKIYPACFDLDNMIVVTNMRSDGNISDVANYGVNSVDVAAPGTDIVSTAPDNMYIYSSGSSFSVPYVACEAALLYQQSNEILSAQVIKEIILDNVTYNTNFKNICSSEGHINIYKAIQNCN